MAVNTMAINATTGGPAVMGMATFTLLGVQIPTMSFLVAIALGAIVRLYVNRKSAKKRISSMDNLMLSSITLIISVGIVVEYQLSFFHSIIVSVGTSFAGETVIVTMGDQMIAIIKDFFTLLKNRIGITSSSTPTNASKTPSEPLSEPSEPVSTPSSTLEKEAS